MTRSFTTITVVAAMLMPAEALPREATLLNFPVIQDAKFVLLEPGSPGLSDELQSKQSSEDLNHDFQSFGYKAAVFEPPRESIGHVQIPRWMRAPQILNIPRRSPSNWSIESACVETAYLPRPGLHLDAQLRRKQYFSRIVTAACANGVPVALFDALLMQESRYRPDAKSHVGAIGMAQLMPATAGDLGVSNAWDVEQNLDGGARYLRKQLDRFGDWRLALAAYNAGPGNVLKHGGVPPFRETRDYVRKILGSIATYR
ncbi:MAG: lytic transglycosylase domain-containing protein [Alteraurantiacibacter sp.]